MNYRVAITGATSGIGRATALKLSKPDFELILIGRNEANLIAISAECLNLGARSAVPVPCDIRDPQACIRIGLAMSDAPAPDRFGLVNAAGIFSMSDPANFNLKECQDLIQTNLLGTIYVTQSCLPELCSKPGSVIASVHSIAGFSALPGTAIYGASKAGSLQYCRTLRAELRTKGLIVSNVILGATDTEIWGKNLGSIQKEDMIPAEIVAHHLANLIQQDPRASVDEVHLLPPKGVL